VRGRNTTAHAIIAALVTVAPPGGCRSVPGVLAGRVPDLELRPSCGRACAGLDGVGTVPEIWLRGLNTLAWLCGCALLPSLLHSRH